MIAERSWCNLSWIFLPLLLLLRLSRGGEGKGTEHVSNEMLNAQEEQMAAPETEWETSCSHLSLRGIAMVISQTRRKKE